MFSEEGCPLDHQYGPNGHQWRDTERHDGKLAKAGVPVGANGKGYLSAGKWIKGDQVTSLKHSKNESVMRRRTVTMGGGLSGLAHNAPGKGRVQSFAARHAAKSYKNTDSNGYTRERYENDAFGPTNAAFYGRLSGSFFSGYNG